MTLMSGAQRMTATAHLIRQDLGQSRYRPGRGGHLSHLYRPAPFHEVTTPQAFEGLKLAGRKVRRPDATFAVADHNIPTSNRSRRHRRPGIEAAGRHSGTQCQGIRRPLFPGRQHRPGHRPHHRPGAGLCQPGMTIVCGDSHTATHGAMGALAFGIGTSEVEHVLATQTLIQAPPKTCWSRSTARSAPGSARRT